VASVRLAAPGLDRLPRASARDLSLEIARRWVLSGTDARQFGVSLRVLEAGAEKEGEVEKGILSVAERVLKGVEKNGTVTATYVVVIWILLVA